MPPLKLKDGEPLVVKRNGKVARFIQRCCRCGLRHRIETTIGKTDMTVRFWRLEDEDK